MIRFFLLTILFTFFLQSSYSQVLWEGKEHNADSLVATGISYLRGGNVSKAVELSQAVLKKYPNYVDFSFILAQAYTLSQQYTIAESMFRSILTQSPNYYDAYYGLSRNLWLQHKNEEALLVWTNLPATIKDNPYILQLKSSFEKSIEGERLHKSLGDIHGYIKDKKFDIALSNLDSLLTIYPERLDFQKLKAQIYFDNKNYRESASLYKILINEGYEKEDSYLKLAQVYALEKNFQEAYLVMDTLWRADQTNADYKELQTYYKDNINYKTFVSLEQSFISYDRPNGIFKLTGLGVGVKIKPTSTFIGQVNWGDLRNGRGYQYVLDNWSNYTRTLYSYTSIGYSSIRIFPNWRAAYSLYKDFGSWQFDIGARYMKPHFNDGILTGVLSVGRYIGPNLLSARVFISNEKDRLEKAFLLSWRYYYNSQKPETYFTVIGNIGTSPDDQERYQFYNNPDVFKSYSIGMGLSHRISKYVLGGQGTWGSYKISDLNYLNEYNLTISVKRFF